MIKTTGQLIDKIAADLAWRRKELTALKGLATRNGNSPVESQALIRCAVALLYSHWEGFVKKTSHYYLEYVASQRLQHNKLTANFIGLILKAKFAELKETEKLSGGNALADFFCTQLESRSNIPYKKGVDTKSNLSSTVLTDILSALGLSSSAFSTRLHYIDSKLVDQRNHIAHGAELLITLDDYISLHDDVMNLIEIYRTEIENAAVLRQFERV